MKRGERQRQHPRFPCRLEPQGRKLAPLGNPQETETVIRGETQNISRGGVCVLSSRPIPTSSLVRCAIEVSETRAAIPTIMQGRWAQKTSTNGAYKIGLQFLL
jgi:hypothetical protein